MYAIVSFNVNVDLDKLGIDQERLKTHPEYVEKTQLRILERATELMHDGMSENPLITGSDIEELID